MDAGEKLREFAHSYIKKFEDLASKVPQDERTLIFRSYLATPHKVTCYVSETSGLAVEFGEVSASWSIDLIRMTERIEERFFSDKSTNPPFWSNNGVNNKFIGLNLLKQAFFDANKEILEKLSSATNLILNGPGLRIEMISGDIKLIDIGLGWREADRNSIKKIECLWLFADNTGNSLSVQMAEERATQDYESSISDKMRGISLSLLFSTLGEYQKLVDSTTVKEEELQKFLAANLVLLEHSYKRVLTKGDLRALNLPEADFLVELHDQSYIIVEIETPHDDILTKETHPLPAKDLRIAEVQIQSYLAEFKKTMLFCMTKLPNITPEKLGGLVIIGRSSKLTEKQREAFRHVVASRRDYTIITYDELFSKTKALLENLSIRYGPFTR